MVKKVKETRGRPRLAKGTANDVLRTIAISEIDFERLMATANGRTFSAYVRQLIQEKNEEHLKKSVQEKSEA